MARNNNTRTRDTYIHAGATVSVYPDAEAVVALEGDKLAMVFHGKKAKPEFYLSFPNDAQRQEYIKYWLNIWRKEKAGKDAYEAAKRAFKPSLKVGDILVNSWGWEQTNVDYYQVVGVKGASVVVRKIDKYSKETSSMIGVCWPIPGSFIGEPMTKRVLIGNEIKVSNYKTGENARLVEVDTLPDNSIAYRSACWSSYA